MCDTHPTYKANRPPKAACKECWLTYFENHREQAEVAVDAYYSLIFEEAREAAEKSRKPSKEVMDMTFTV